MGLGISVSQLVALFGVLIGGLGLIFSTVDDGMVPTALLYVLVISMGFLQSHRTAAQLRDPKLHSLGYLWLIKIVLMLLLLYVGWIPQLDPRLSSSWGYDPQRYYQDAFNLIHNGWMPEVGTNYQGIIYFYGFVFYAFGHNPVAPALVNAFITLSGALYLINSLYDIKMHRSPRDWTLAFVVLFPEIIWYDVMTSRETLTAVVIVIATLAAGKYITGVRGATFGGTAITFAVALLIVLAVRTTMAIPILGAVAAMALFLHAKKGIGPVPKLIILALAFGLTASGPLIQRTTGGYEMDYWDVIKRAQMVTGNAAAEEGWANRSVGMLLIPSNPIEGLLFSIPRVILYLSAPLPSAHVPLSQLAAGSWLAWQTVMTIPSSVLNIIMVPIALAGMMHAIRLRAVRPALLVPHFALWAVLYGIAAGNVIIHERYRVMMTLLLCGCAWLGYTTADRAKIRQYSRWWYGMLAFASALLLTYKVT